MKQVPKLESVVRELKGFATKKIIIKGYDLSRIREFLQFIGNPHDAYPIIHVTGTAGKGSTTEFIRAALHYSGFKTGAYFSPHIHTPLERIKLNDKYISEGDFINIYNFIKLKHDKFFKNKQGLTLTYFEFLLVIAFEYFKRKEIDVLVLEVGLGGRLDPTNIVNSDIAVITNVDLDHTKLLGSTVEKIAKDKVQIVKFGTVCVTGVKKKSVLSIIRDYCHKQASRLRICGVDFKVQRIKMSLEESAFVYQSKDLMYAFKITLPGAHQTVNAGIAVDAVLQFLEKNNIRPDLEKIAAGLQQAFIPGRIEVIQKRPLMIWDSAHNGVKMKALVATLNDVLPEETGIRMLLAFKKGQDFKRLLTPLERLKNLKEIVLTKYKVTQDLVYESEKVQTYLKYLKHVCPGTQITVEEDIGKAYLYLRRKTAIHDCLLVTGSFYLLDALTEISGI